MYKVQLALFGEPAILIYNEDRSDLCEITSKKQIREMRNFIGKTSVKAYVAGYKNEQGQIIMEKVIPYKIWKDYNW